MPPRAFESLQAQTLENTVGAAFLGVVCASILFGITTLQAYYYFHNYPKDRKLFKLSVTVLWILDTLHLCLIIQAVWHYVVIGFGDIEGLQVVIWSIKLQLAINVVIILIVQSLYALRVWWLGGYHHGILGYLVAGVVGGGFVVGIVLVYETYQLTYYSELENMAWAAEASFATSTSIDFSISLAMCYYLRKSRGRISTLNSRISHVMQYSLSSGLFTSACSLASLFTFILMPNNFVFLGVTFLLTQFYVGSFLTMLNARQRSSGRREDTSTINLKVQTSIGQTRSLPSAAPSDPESQLTTDKSYAWDISMPQRVALGPGLRSPVEDGIPGYAQHW